MEAAGSSDLARCEGLWRHSQAPAGHHLAHSTVGNTSRLLAQKARMGTQGHGAMVPSPQCHPSGVPAPLL